VGGLTAAELATIRGRLETFADDLFASLPRVDQRTRGQCYLRGLMLDGRRKSIEPRPSAWARCTTRRCTTLSAVSPWDWRPVRRRLAEVLTARFARPRGW
jgi:SRSO17 transposase